MRVVIAEDAAVLREGLARLNFAFCLFDVARSYAPDLR